MRTRGIRAATAGALLVLVALLPACAGPDPAAVGGPVTPAPVLPVPAGTRVLTGTDVATAAAVDTGCDPVASRPPLTPLPAAGAAPAGTAMARIVERGVLVVGVDQNTVPFGYRDPATRALTGFDIALAREMARALLGDPSRVNFRVESSSQRIPALEAGDVDLVVQTMTTTCERRRRIDFSSVYYEASQRVLVPRGSTVRGLADLGGRPVCSIAGSTSLATLAAAPSRPVPVAVPEKSDCLVLLQQGQVDAISTDDTILAGFAREDPGVEVRGPAIASEPYAIGVSRRSPELVAFVNGVLDRLRADGTWARIYTATFGPGPVPPPPTPVYRG